ncbi:uncharacterized protein [Asterias amurensis]|uniref:uncharacterized protein isoform X2 n=1 Tax=Asterias amurensis TaxID=7602 RepID=UPI003AB4D683
MVMELVSWLLAGCAGNLIPAYYGGEARCDQEVGIQGDYDPTELVCGACSDVSRAQMCPKHGTDFLEYNCRYCRSVAVFFCFGRPHISAMLATMTSKGSPAFQSQIFLTALLRIDWDGCCVGSKAYHLSTSRCAVACAAAGIWISFVRDQEKTQDQEKTHR